MKPQTNGTNAEVVDGHLVLSLLDAQEPKIWRIALEKIGTASFEVKQTKESDETKLVLKPKKGTAEIIASYDTKAQAVAALTNASLALQGKKTSKGQTNEVSAAQTSAPQPAHNTGKQGSKWGLLFLGVLLVIGLYIYLTSMMPQIAPITTGAGTSTTTPTQSQTGVPMSADDFLSGM